MSRAKMYEVPSGMVLEDWFLQQLADGLHPAEFTSEAARFIKTYEYDPLAFVHDCITFEDTDGPTVYQEEILGNFIGRGRTSVRSPHGVGKTALAAWLTIWSILTAEDIKTPTTASAWRQLQKYLWPEIHKWIGRLRWHKLVRTSFKRDEQMALALRLGPTREAFAVASNNAALIEGAHARRIVYVFDEAKAIPDATWDAAEGAFSAAGEDVIGEAFALAISTPGTPHGRFYDIHRRKPGFEDWYAKHVTLEEAIEAKRISREWAEQRKRQWGENSAVYQNRVLGEFASDDVDGVIPLAWVEKANERWREWRDNGAELTPPMTALGVDPGRGRDPTIFAPRYGWTIPTVDRYIEKTTMPLTGRIISLLETFGGEAVVDVIGIGAGVVDRLREQGYDVVAFTASGRTEHTDRSGEIKYANMRAAAWWTMRELLDPELGEEIALPPDDDLTGDLTAPHYSYTSTGKLIIESKDQIRRRLGRSTNHADAVIQALTGPTLYEEQWGGIVSVLELPWH